MMTADSLSDIKARLSQQDHSVFLGRLVWYSVSKATFDYGRVATALYDNGFGESIPNPPSDADTFRRACTDTKRSRVATSNPDIYCNYTVRDVGFDRKTLYRTIVRETVNTADRKLSHESEMCRLTFHKLDGTIDVSCTGVDAVANDMAQEVLGLYHTERGRVTSFIIRELIRTLLVDMHATNVRKAGGVYFIGEDRGDKVEAIERFASLVSDNDNVVVHSLPLIDDMKQRDMIRKALETETHEAVEGLTNKIADLIQSGTKISKEAYFTFLEQYERMSAKAETYAGLLTDNLDYTRGQLQILEHVVIDLNLNVTVEDEPASTD